MKKRIITTNLTAEGCAPTIRAGYYKAGLANFINRGGADGFGQVGLIEIEDADLEHIQR